MTVTLTSPVEGKQPGDTYTGANEAFLVANGYAKKQAGPFTGPGLDNTGAASTTVANDNTAHSERALRAKDSSLGDGGGTNSNVILGPPDTALVVYTETAAPTAAPTTPFDGFANDPSAIVSTVTKADGSAATGLAAAGGTALKATGYGFRDATGVTVGGTAATAFGVDSDRQVHFTTPPKAAGTYDVVVQRPEGNLTKVGAATFV